MASKIPTQAPSSASVVTMALDEFLVLREATTAVAGLKAEIEGLRTRLEQQTATLELLKAGVGVLSPVGVGSTVLYYERGIKIGNLPASAGPHPAFVTELFPDGTADLVVLATWASVLHRPQSPVPWWDGDVQDATAPKAFWRPRD